MSTSEQSQESPLNLASQVESLLAMPSSLCNQCGWSCRLVTFKGLTSAEMVQNLAASEGEGAEQARDFLSLFTPYETQAEVKEMAPVFVERVRDVAVSKGLNPDETSFFKCRYLQPDSRCGVYEDRPEGCRRYPLAHPNTIFHPGCGFEKQSKQNWAQIELILQTLGLDNTGKPMASA